MMRKGRPLLSDFMVNSQEMWVGGGGVRRDTRICVGVWGIISTIGIVPDGLSIHHLILTLLFMN